MVFPEDSLEHQLITHLEQNLDIADLARQLFKENPLFLHEIYLKVETYEDTDLFEQLLEKLPQEILHAALLSLDEQGNTLFFLLIQTDPDSFLYEKIIALTAPAVMSQVWLTPNNNNFLPLCFAIKERPMDFAQMLVEMAPAEAINQAFYNAEDNKQTIWHMLLGFSENFDPIDTDQLIKKLRLFFEKVAVTSEQIDKVFKMFCHEKEKAFEYLLVYPDKFADADTKKIKQDQQIIELADKSGISVILLGCLNQYVSLSAIEEAIDYMLEYSSISSEEILEEILENKHDDVDFQNIDFGEIEQDIVEEDERNNEPQPKPQKHTYSVFFQEVYEEITGNNRRKYDDDSSEESSLCHDSQPKPPSSPSRSL